jgi:hypothetical protein
MQQYRCTSTKDVYCRETVLTFSENDGSGDGHRSSDNTCACRPGLRAAACSGKAYVSVVCGHIQFGDRLGFKADSLTSASWKKQQEKIDKDNHWYWKSQ